MRLITLEARVFLCKEAAQLYGLQQRKRKKGKLRNVGNRGVGNLRLIGLVGLGPASRVFTFHLLDSLVPANNNKQNVNMPPYDLVFQQENDVYVIEEILIADLRELNS